MAGDRADKRDVEDAHATTSPAAVRAHDTTATEPAPAVPTPSIARASLPPVLATRYELKRVIGVGGMGLVYEALDLNLHRLVALKVLKLAPTKAEERADAVNRLVREARAMAALSHKNVVTVHDVGFHEDQVFVAMQLVEGTTMRQWLQAQKRGLYQILGVLYEAGSGLAAAHAARLIHRDFKPDNILVSQRGTVRVTDFGLARRSDGLIEPTGIAADRVSAPGAVLEGDNVDVTSVTRSGAIVGTPAYMAPEQAAGAATDARADQFSFCVTAWEALYGARPFAGKNWSEIYTSVQQQKIVLPEANRTVPRAIQKALRRGLAVDPAERFPSMVELLAVFEEALQIPIRRRRAIAIGGAIAAMIAAVVVSRAIGKDETPKPAEPVAAHEAPLVTPPPAMPSVGMTPADRIRHATRTKPAAPEAPPVVTPAPVPTKPRVKPDVRPDVKPEAKPTPTATIAPPAPAQEPVAPPAPTVDPRLAGLESAHASLDQEYERRELLAADLPPDYAKAKQALRDALAAKDADRAASELAAARAAIASVKIDRGFVNDKMQRLNARIGRLPKDRQDELKAKLIEVLKLFGDDQFVAANRKINQIARTLATP